MTHLVLIVVFALLCAAWAALQLSSGREMDSSCGACSLRGQVGSECDGTSCGDPAKGHRIGSEGRRKVVAGWWNGRAYATMKAEQ